MLDVDSVTLSNEESKIELEIKLTKKLDNELIEELAIK